jgi:glutathione S-transferase
MKLYYSKGACSQAAHIILHEAGLPHDSAAVNLRQKRLDDGSDYLRINPKGAVPALELDSGEVLTENAVVLQYIADHAGAFDLLPRPGEFQRYRVLEWLNFIATELHKGFAPLFNPAAGDEAKQLARDTISRKLDYVERQLGDRPYLLGDQFTLPDAYLFVILGWAGKMKIDLGGWPKLTDFRKRVAQRPAVRAVLEFEGLLEKEAAD